MRTGCSRALLRVSFGAIRLPNPSSSRTFSANFLRPYEKENHRVSRFTYSHAEARHSFDPPLNDRFGQSTVTLMIDGRKSNVAETRRGQVRSRSSGRERETAVFTRNNLESPRRGIAGCLVLCRARRGMKKRPRLARASRGKVGIFGRANCAFNGGYDRIAKLVCDFLFLSCSLEGSKWRQGDL